MGGSRASLIERLAVAGCVAAYEEADELLAAAPGRDVPEDWIRRREQGEPLAWITGRVTFCGRRLQIDRGVYVPRLQSEDLARRAGARLAHTQGRAVDLCTGSGAIANHMSAVAPGAIVVGMDIDPAAVRCARVNGVSAVRGDLAASPLMTGAFDVVTAVAPYVPTPDVQFLPADVQRYEPRTALDGGPDGLALVRLVVTAAAELLRPGGWLLTEVGGDQDWRLAPDLAAAGFTPPTTWHDEDGDLRGLQAELRPRNSERSAPS
jgi:release factor glutamine methyltransferase